MAKIKIYDIKPPKKRQAKIISQEKKRKIPFKKFLFVLLGLILVLIFAREFIYASRATIEIWPKSEKVTFEVFLTGEENLEDINLITQTIPLSKLEETFTISEKFSSTQKEIKERAKGTIRVYNKYHLPVTLIAKTRFQSASEPPRVFLATEKFTIPANGYTDIEVVAAEAGEEYNIEPTSFSVPGLRKYSPTLFYKVYGRSFSKMKGGRMTKGWVITEEDVENAKNTLLKQIEKEALAKLSQKAGKNYQILEKTLNTEVLSTNLLDAQIGDEKKDFLYQIEVEAEISAIKFDHLLKFAKEYINSKIPPEKNLYPGSLLLTNIQSNVDVEGTVTIDVEFEGEIYSQIDKESLKEIAKRQEVKNIKKYIREIYPEIKKEPNIKLSPFFAKRAPRDPSKIEVILKFQ
ncbi:MAG: hypothetical protein LR000_00185 [Candidatus Pacebacteria bacterium]|nr:hypothetical protein [Candidatus Paceibacterota bacterium]